MTKIQRKNNKKNTELKDVWATIDRYLPRYGYTSRVYEIMGGRVSIGTIRNIRTLRNGNLEVINALLKVALEEKTKIRKLSINAKK